jgi:hypothetical protein
MGKFAAFCLFLSIASPALAAEPWSICIAKTPAQATEKAVEVGLAPSGPYAFAITVGTAGTFRPRSGSPLLVSPLPSNKPIPISITSHGKPFASFVARAADLNGKRGCVWLNTFYQTWSLRPASEEGSKCRCADNGR